MKKKQDNLVISADEFLAQFGIQMTCDELDKAIRFNREKDEVAHKAIDQFSRLFRRPKKPGLNLKFEGIGFRNESHGTEVVAYYFEETLDLMLYNLNYRWKSDIQDIESYLEQNRERVLQIVLTREGEKFLFEKLNMGWDALRRDMLIPGRFCHSKIGSGSEGDVYKYSVNGHAFAVKLFSQEAQDRVNEFARIFRMKYPKPNFATNIGCAKCVLSEVNPWPKMRYTLSPLVEYAASQSYFVMELGPAFSVLDMFIAAKLEKNDEKRKSNVSAAAEFMHKNRVLKSDLTALQQELVMLVKIGELLKCKNNYLAGSRKRHDFFLNNFLVRKFDQLARCFDLVLIDQGQDPVGTHDPYDFFDPEREKILIGQKAYDLLVKVPMYKKYITSSKIKRPVEPKKRQKGGKA